MQQRRRVGTATHHQPQRCCVRAQAVGLAGVPGVHRLQHPRLPLLPVAGREPQQPRCTGHPVQAQLPVQRIGLVGAQVSGLGEVRQIDPIGRGIGQRRQRGGRVGRGQCSQLRQALRLAAAARRAEGIDHPAAAQRAVGCRITQDEAVAPGGADRPVQHQACQRGLARRCFGQQRQAGRHRRGAQVQQQLRARPGQAGGAGHGVQQHVQLRAGGWGIGGGQPVAAGRRGALQFGPGQVDGTALARLRCLHGHAQHLQAAHPQGLALRQQLHRITHLHLARQHRTSHHAAGTVHGKAAVDGQAEVTSGG